MYNSESPWNERNGKSGFRWQAGGDRALPSAGAPVDPALDAGWDSAGQEPEGGAGGASIGSYLAALRRRKLLIALTAIGGILFSMTTLVLEPLVYLSRTTIEVQGFNENFLNIGSVDPQAGMGNYSATDANIQTQIRILESLSLKNRVLRKLQREVTPLRPPQNSWSSRLRTKLKIGSSDPMVETNRALEMASKTVKGTGIRGTRIMEIRCESTIPYVAALFVNTLSTEYIDQAMETRLKSGQQTSRWLLNQIAETKSKLENAETRLRDHIRRSGVLFVEQDTLTVSKLRQLQADLAAIQGDRIAKQSRYEMMRSTPPDALPEVLNDGALRDYQGQITDLRKEMAQLTLTLTPEHYKVKRLEAQIAEIEAALKKTRQQIFQRIESEYRAALSQEKNLAAAYSAQSAMLVSQSDKTNEHQILKREVDITQQSYNILLQQANQAGLASAIPANHIQVIDPAEPKPEPFRPIPTQRAGMGLMAGLVLGCALAIWREMNDRTVREPGLGDYMRVPELGVIPTLETQKRVRPARSSLGELNGAVPAGAERLVELVTWQQKPSLHAESFRVALASILVDRHERPQVMVLTSPGPSEGKTTVSCNMAIAMTEANRRILLIDMDLRKPRLHEVFNLRHDRGVSDVLQSTVRIEEYPFELVIQASEVPGLSVMASGPAPDSIMGALYSPRFAEMLYVLRRHYDAILIDTPPMLRFPDARIIARMAEGVVLVLRSGKTDRAAAIMARQRFEADGTRVIGVILNDWDLSSPGAKNYAGPYYYSTVQADEYRSKPEQNG